MPWKQFLSTIEKSDYFVQLCQKVASEYEKEKCFPPKEKIFRALELCPPENIKVVILGQDPYHDDNQANGLAFSVSNFVKTPPSLRNIFKELQNDLEIERKQNDLEDWAKQGVLLLNVTLTVKAHQANSHQELGWEKYTDFIIKKISENKENIVFVLWGSYAQKKIVLIDTNKHYIISSAHPSPLAAYRGFFGSKPFSKINNYLIFKNKTPISWGEAVKSTLF
ncbi:MAG: uracil-DNA glycosylase [Bacteroidetes bacterium]|jgi:uracil-DNA glycosylase|nr:uracil-DNA glycosylase [Bacteroidota bacterium]